MEQVNGENNPEAPPNIPVKRKRGRPRKDPSQSINHRESAHVPPGFEGVNGSKPLQLDAIEDSDNGVVGQSVTGVVEAAFDAGYLLSVRIGNSNTNLRGVVFKPGHFVPISAENDVAPHVQMIRRNEISLPLVNQARTHGRHRRSRGRNARHVSPLSNSIVPAMGSRGTVVPVVLQPVNLSNGVLFPNQVPQVSYQTGHFADPRYIQVQPVSNLQASQNQTSNLVVPAGLHGENGPYYQVGDNVNAMKQGEVKRNVAQTEDGAAGKTSDDSDDVEEPLDVEPLQAIHTYVHNQSQPVHKPLEIKSLGSMTELLQVNMTGNQLHRVENMATRDSNAQE